jgi:hypothetical protein
MRVTFLLCPPIRLVVSLAEVMPGKFCRLFGPVSLSGGSEVVLCDPGGVVGKNEVDPKEVVVVDGVGDDAVARRRLGVVF